MGGGYGVGYGVRWVMGSEDHLWGGVGLWGWVMGLGYGVGLWGRRALMGSGYGIMGSGYGVRGRLWGWVMGSGRGYGVRAVFMGSGLIL